MTRVRTATRASRLLVALAAALLLAPSCTAFDQFKFADPEPSVSLEGELLASAAPVTPGSLYPPGAPRPTCPVGTTVYWGTARNTGDVDVEQVTALVDVYGADEGFLGRFREFVYSGEVGKDLVDNENPSTSLQVDELGHFIVCTNVRWGSAARAEFTSEFVVIEQEDL